MTDQPRIELPDWARAALQVNFTETPKSAATKLNDGPAWPLLVDAAVVSTFLPSALAQSESGPGRSEAERAVLSVSEPTLGPSGLTWSLRRDTRREVLNLAKNTGDLQPALDRTSALFSDQVSRAMRDCLRGNITSLSSSLQQLEATRLALGILSDVEGVRAPKSLVEALDREVELRRLLVQFERMVGQTPDATDHFVGREDELEQLRRYVGVVKAGTITAGLMRGVYRTGHAFSEWTPFALTGVGGVGKTTLLAKFMLEHAHAAASAARFPFAFVDFDRPTISGRNRAGILAEMAGQVASQFAELSEPMLKLRREVRETGRKFERVDDGGGSISLLFNFIFEFRTIIDRYLVSVEKTFESARPFLLVFDTFEVVQYSRDDEIAIEEFVRALLWDTRGFWKRLRVVVSGRRPIGLFLTTPEKRVLGSLDEAAAAQMLARLAADAGKPIAIADAQRLVAGICAIDQRVDVRLKPQRLRIIGEQFASSKIRDGREFVDDLLAELRDKTGKPGALALALVDAIVIRRTLGNVSDRRVRALADPGLVVRRITPDVIREVMAKGTPKPKDDAPPPDDDASFEPWSIDEAEAQNIFAAFAKEVTLVDMDGAALRHRQDVRQDMLPVIRAGRPKRFAELQRLAYSYFRTLADADPTDDAAAAEAVYHGLWANAALRDVDAYWRETPTFDPRIDREEFDPGSLSDVYVRAKTRGTLAPDEIALLPRSVALRWIAAAKDDFARERRPAATLATIREGAGRRFEVLDQRPDVAAIVARLLFRAGEWDEAVRLIERHLRGSRDDTSLPHVVSLFRTYGTLVGKAAVSPPHLDEIRNLAPRFRDPLVRAEALSHAAIGGQSLSMLWRDDPRSEVTKVAAEVPAGIWSSELRCLRLAILTSRGVPFDLLRLYVASMERLPRDRDAVPFLVRLFSESSPLATPKVAELVRRVEQRDSPLSLEMSIDWDRSWREERRQFLELLPRHPAFVAALRGLIAFQHHDWTTPLGNAMTIAFEQDSELKSAVTRRQFVPSQAWTFSDGRVDGVALAQLSADTGRFLDLARMISEWGRRRPGTADPKAGSQKTLALHDARRQRDDEYPADALALTGCFLRWHRAITTLLDEDLPLGV